MKIAYDNIAFDSQLEIDYYKLLKERQKKNEIIRFIYHPKSIMISKNNKYTPDFIVVSKDKVEIVETKGYSQFSFMKDNLTHNIMLEKTEDELKQYVESNNVDTNNKQVLYKKIKFLKTYGFVDWGFKNPNSQINKTRAKRDELQEELKECKKKIKDYERYLNYTLIKENHFTKTQQEWLEQFKAKYIKEHS